MNDDIVNHWQLWNCDLGSGLPGTVACAGLRPCEKANGHPVLSPSSRLQIYFGATHIQRHAHVCHRKTTLIRSEGRGPAASVRVPVNRTTDRL